MAVNLDAYRKDLQHRYEATFMKPFLVTVQGKYAEQHHLRQTLDDLGHVALAVVAHRLRQKFLTFYRTAEKPPLELAATRHWPDTQLKRAVIDAWNVYTLCVRRDEERQRVVEAATEAVKTGNGLLAIWVLEQRNEYEYERVEWMPFDTAEVYDD
ncbi:MAG: hypothetical protein OEY69_00065 [Candidatus Krumholzibacteria bacterium]|nr:hypothetical protein [Candidatus Krumholzibacteria bacterium]